MRKEKLRPTNENVISGTIPPKRKRPFMRSQFKFLLAVFITLFFFTGNNTLNAQAPTSSCDDPIEVSSTICGNDTSPNTPSGGWGSIPADGTETFLFGFPGGAFIEIDFNCLSDDSDAVGDLGIRLASSTFVTGDNPCSIYLENVYDVRDSDLNEALELLTILVEFTGCSSDTEAPVVSCTEFSATFDDCPDGFGPNTPDGDWFPIGPSGGLNNAVGGIFTSFLDLSTCVSDNATSLADLEITLTDSYSENVVPGCSIDLINEFSVRDACGNVSANPVVFRGTIEYSGTTPPVITCPANVGVECGDSIDPADTGMATATSECGTATVTFEDSEAPACGSTAVITRTWTATDGCGTTSTCEQIITTFDTNPPVAPTAPAPVTVECDAIPMAEELMAMDACEGMILGTSEDVIMDGACANSYTITRTWTFADDCGNSSSVSQTITVEDTTPPDVTCAEFTNTFSGCPDPIGPNTPSGNWISLPSNGMINTAVGGIYTFMMDVSSCLDDNCTDLGNLEYMISDSYSENRIPGCSVDIINEFMIRDECGNVSPTIFNFRGTIMDMTMTAPTVVNAPENQMIEACANGNPNDEIIGLEDTNGAPGAPIDFGASFTIYGESFNAPALSDFADDCDNGMQLLIWNVIQGSTAGPAPDTDLPCVRQVRVIYRVQDGCGNQSSNISQYFYIQDETQPTFPNPPNQTIDITDSGICPYPDAEVSLSADPDFVTPLTAGDDFTVHGMTFQVPGGFSSNCDVDVNIYLRAINQERPGSEEPCTRVIRLRWSVIDECGNQRNRNQTFTINDMSIPVITCPASLTVECDASTDPMDTGMATATDYCDASPSIMSLDMVVPGACPQEMVINRTWTATDACDMSATCVQVITVDDSTPPELMLPPNVVVECGESTEPGEGTPSGSTTADGTTGAIPDNDPAGESYTATVAGLPAGAVVTGATVSLDITHTWVGDLDATLTSPDGTVLNLFDRPGEPDVGQFGCNIDNMSASFSDSAPNSAADLEEICDVTLPATIVGEFQPIDPFSGVNDEAAAGDWVLTISDNGGGDTGSVTEFSVTIDWTTSHEGGGTGGTGVATAMDNCDDAPLVEVTNEVSNVTVCDGGTIVRTWTTTDACGNSISGDQTILVNPPNAPMITLCPANATVTCEEDVIPTPDALEADVDCDLGSEVTVSDPVIVGQPGCDGTTYTFTYTITDDCGRTDECMQTFTLDNNAPTVTVPADATVECASDIEVSTDEMTVVQDCPGELILSVNGPVIEGPENCPGTTYTYTYRAIDDCGRVVNVNRVFTIGTNDAPTITAPADYEVTCLAGSIANPDWATYTTACGNGVEAEVTTSGPQIIGALDCPGTRYIYTYTVTDACGRSASDTQTLTVANDGPQLTCPAPLQVFGCLEGGYNDKIEAWIETVEASSSCGLDLTVSNNFNGNAGICLGNNFTTVTFSATDACGRSASCQGTIAITDTDAPIIYVEPQELLVPCTGNTQQIFNDWLATQGGAQATDACWGDQVNWSASVGPNALNCANGPQAIVVTFTATDGCGNAATTVGIFNTKLLPNQVNVNGLIMREDNEPVANVEVGAYLGGALPQMDLSDSAGDYAFEELEYVEDTEIKPEKNDDPLNGVSTFDLVLLQQHILALNYLDSPYKRIAADVNRSGNVTTLDLVLLRKLILHIDEEFTDNTSWRFVDADYVFPNPQNPFATEFPEIYNATGEEEEVADFIAVKIGDLNLDGDTYGLMSTDSDDRSSLEVLGFKAEDKSVKAGGTYQVDFTTANFDQINGFQFTLNFDQELVEILHIEAGDLVNFDEKNFNLAKRDNGAIPMSWNMDIAQDLRSEDVAFSVIVKAINNTQLSEVLTISSQYTRAEAYHNTELMNVDLIFNSELQTIASSKFKLYQNVPNPFMDATTIGFQLPEASEVTLEVYDVSGRVLISETGAFAKGFNQFDVDRGGLPVGVLYYKITTTDRSATMKMILVK